VEIEDLIVVLAGSRRGLTIEQISERYAVSRRTAERMRDAVAERFPLVETDRAEGDRRKRWRIDGRALRELVRLEACDAETVAEAARVLRELGQAGLARELSRVEARIRVLG
jgi:predicted DNA-binding transcriptional regulator YafY